MEKVENWLQEWLDLWPDDVKWNNVKIKSSYKDCINKMKKFCKDNPTFTKEEIFTATKMYLTDKQRDDWQYTKRATYFISKVGHPSALEDYVAGIQIKKPLVNNSNMI